MLRMVMSSWDGSIVIDTLGSPVNGSMLSTGRKALKKAMVFSMNEEFLRTMSLITITPNCSTKSCKFLVANMSRYRHAESFSSFSR
ncbi:Uncharacterised protein [Segatella copri]|nr:Uncharacterised protein [Segatella copri]